MAGIPGVWRVEHRPLTSVCEARALQSLHGNYRKALCVEVITKRCPGHKAQPSASVLAQRSHGQLSRAAQCTTLPPSPASFGTLCPLLLCPPPSHSSHSSQMDLFKMQIGTCHPSVQIPLMESLLASQCHFQPPGSCRSGPS